MSLAVKNAHPRDAAIRFEADGHRYFIAHDPASTYTSVTTWNHSHFASFDADAIARKVTQNPRSPYWNRSVDDVKAEWEANRDQAAQAGTALHAAIEDFYNGLPVDPVVEASIEYHYFQNFVQSWPTEQAVPYRTEWMIYDDELKLAGSIDMVFQQPDGALWIYDWKRCKELRKTPTFGQWATTDCIGHLPDTNFWHYALQLNTYKALLEKNYGAKVVKLALVVLHPDQKQFQVTAVPNLTEEVAMLLALRLTHVNKST